VRAASLVRFELKVAIVLGQNGLEMSAGLDTAVATKFLCVGTTEECVKIFAMNAATSSGRPCPIRGFRRFWLNEAVDVDCEAMLEE
jgi:hypothetical protein